MKDFDECSSARFREFLQNRERVHCYTLVGRPARSTMAEESAEYAKGMLGLLRGLLAVHRQVNESVDSQGRRGIRRMSVR
ncbi:uncharacterized protein LOC102673079 isoform X2 [Apis dorsata]|uniref:uncharacterized protein LOC102673079 isoform X2 n=1 Tax=Apis dorsata TaxID=7462 RepID=UPI001293B9CF|nr:uncharacterized protein LOC102673079 isoform X2 [Apis dorsata]